MATVLEVNVLSPTGGTVAQAGTTFTVTWFSTGATGQRVLYSIDGGNSFTPIVTGLDGSVRSYDWAIPASLVPAGQASIGAIVRVGVKNDSGASTTNDSPPFTIQSAATTAPAPSIAGASPSSGPAAGGTSITINGQNFKTGLKATLGGVALQISNVTARQITAVTPAESAGAAALSVTNPDGQSATLASAFTFVAPSSGTRTIALQLTDPDPTPDGIQPALASGTSITVNIAAGQTKRIGFTVSVTDANNNPVQETLKIKVSGPMPNGLTLDYPTRVTSCGPGQSGGCGSGTLTIATTLDTPYDTYQFTLDASCVDGMCMPSSASLTLVVKQPRVILSLPDPTNMTARVPAGGTATFPIQISREFYFGSILVQPTNDLPRTATTQPIKIDALPTTAKPNAVYQAQFQVATMATSPSMDGTVPGKYDLTLGTIADPRAKTNQLPLKLVVLPQTPSVSVILSPKSQMGQPGKAARYTVDVYRYNFFGKVDIQLPTELPSGTTFALTPGTPTPISVGGVMVGDLTANLLDITLPAGAQPKAYEFHVGATYKPTNAPSTTVQDSAVLDTSAATPTIDLVITQADTKVGQGGLASIEFEVTRSPMTDANVHLDLGMLAGHTMPVSDVQLDAKMTMGRFDVQLDNDAPLGSYMLTLTATANGEQDQKTTPLQVTALQYVVRLTTNIFGSTKSVKQVMPGDPVVFDVDISRD
ncbi:MAG TPA: IPT/TIG domain-containing protein, partial [Polyangia bacterium]|nr:IPT/TIG domain-containing protein [Polyangia bacterium]